MVAVSNAPQLIRDLEEMGATVTLLPTGKIRLRAPSRYVERFSRLILKHRPEIVAALASRCRCGSFGWHDHSIHGGKSIRRDCAVCGKTAGFPVWRGQRDETLKEGSQ